ncbi:hypothetical protein [Algibacter sp. 2305UL17-15]|uniref:hypothetical protein n=1 Tax=Algibacter sp. 2305UL17-15 TaxID=3231268 RepID=UPI003457D774
MRTLTFSHKFLSCLLLLTLFISCSKDDSDINKADPTAVNLDPNELSEKVIIAGSSYIETDLPTPNKQISFNLIDNDDLALPIEGFNITINSENPILGAYIQFSDNNDIKAKGYFDVNLQLNSFGKSNSPQVKKLKGLNNQTNIFDVDFNDNIKTGVFCYYICVYDEAGNISAPQKVCTTIQLLGGDSVLTNEWIFKKRETFAISDGITEPFTYKVGDIAFSFGGSGDCTETGLRYEYKGENIQGDGKIIFNSDGTYLYEDNSTTDVLDYTATRQQCTPIWLEKINRKFQNSGVWSYIEGDNRLVLISYRRFRLDGDEIAFDQMREPGNGDLFWDATVVLNGNEILIKNGDGVTEDSLWYTYTK